MDVVEEDMELADGREEEAEDGVGWGATPEVNSPKVIKMSF